MKKVMTLVLRDLKRTLGIRTWLIWLAMAGMGVFFFFTTGARTALLEQNKVEYMALFLPHMIFGSWAILSVYFDLISGDREHNVMDCFICSGITKTKIFISKILVTAVISLVLALIYLTPVTYIIIGISKDITNLLIIGQYLLPFWGYIMVFASLGIMISIAARSSKAALIWSLAVGLFMMPRLFVMVVEGIGMAAGWSEQTVERISMVAPGIMMQALSDFTNPGSNILAACIFTISVVILLGVAYFIFRKQDERNYGG